MFLYLPEELYILSAFFVRHIHSESHQIESKYQMVQNITITLIIQPQYISYQNYLAHVIYL